MNTRWHSFRLTTHDSGRVRWCVGNEQQFKKRLQILALIPIALLLIIATYLLLTHFAFTKKHETDPTDIGRTYRFDDDGVRVTPGIDLHESLEELHDDDDDSDDLQDLLQTTFVSNPTKMAIRYSKRKKRETNNEDIVVNTDQKGIPYIDIHINEDQEAIINLKNNNGDNNGSQYKESFWNENLQPMEIRRLQAHSMQKNMDFTANPCVDFYQYACGNWGTNNPIPDDRAGFDTFELLRQNLDLVLKDLLEDKKNNKDNKDPEIDFKEKRYMRHLRVEVNNETLFINIIQKAKYMYRSCMNEELIRYRGSYPLLDLIDRFGGWPIIKADWNETDFDIVSVLGQLRLYNNDILISQWVGPDIKNSEEYVVQIDQATLGLPSREYFLEPINAKYVEAYRMFVVTIANLLGAPMYDASLDATDIINFETELAKIVAPTEHRRNVSHIYKKMTIGALQLQFPQFDMGRFISIVLQRHVKDTETVVCFCWNYMHNLVSLITRTSPRTIANYVLWRFIRHRVNNLDERFEQAKQRFYKVIFGREKSPPRWQVCVSQVNSNLGMALGHMFVEKYFDERSKNDTISMTMSLQHSFRNLLLNTSWLDKNTKNLSLLKIKAMTLKIGYPDYLLHMDNFSGRYNDIAIHPDFYFENTLSILKHLTYVEQKRLGTLVNKALWNTAPAVVNAYYSRNKNQIMFPAGILQPPFYHRFFPKCLNYGGIGVVVGHEITHGFDDKGRLFDRNGNLQKWWSEQAISEFHMRAQCLIEQYSQYVIPEINLQVNGRNTQGENIADNGGVKQAYRAYQTWYNEHPDADESLPDVNLTNNQLFFLNFAQIWCGNIRPEAAKNKLKTSVHSPGKFRVIGALSNSAEFSAAYQCPEGSPMNPTIKCSIW